MKMIHLGTGKTFWLALLVLVTAACAAPQPETPADWPLACSSFPPDGPEIPDCARRGADGEITLRAGIRPGTGEPSAPRAVLVEGDLFYALDSGKTAPVLMYDNGADYFVEGLARSPRDGKIGFVDENLDLVVPRRWDFAFPFEDGIARVCSGCVSHRAEGDEHTEVTGGQWGYVDREGTVVVPVVHPRDELPGPPVQQENR